MINLSRKQAFTLLLFAASATAFLTFPGVYFTVGPGLDPSWEWAINYFAGARGHFGQDLIFTYGPLGYLLVPLPMGSHLEQGIALQFFIAATIWGCAGFLTVRHRSVTSGSLFLIGYLLVCSFLVEFEYQLLSAAAFLLAVGIETRRSTVLGPPTVLCGALLFMKFGTGVSAIAIVLAAVAVWWWRWRTIRGPAVLVSTYLATTVALGFFLLGPATGLREFLRLSLQIAYGYNDAMATNGPNRPVIGALVVIAAFTATTFFLSRRRAPSASILLLLLLPVLLAFKHSFVRADWGHEPMVFGVALAGSVLALAFSQDSRERLTLVCTTLVVLFAFWLTMDDVPIRMRTETFKSLITGARGRQRIHSLLHFSETKSSLDSDGVKALQELDRLPAEWLESIGQNAVLVVPAELALCPANNLRCQAYPTMQMYLTYTRDLDRWTADQIRRRAPDFVIADVSAIDRRNMVWDCPETWLALAAGWDVVARVGDPARLLLRRRTESLPVTETLLVESRAKVNEWLQAPSTGKLLRAGLETRKRLTGRLRSLFFRSDPVFLQVKFRNGRIASYRIVLDTVRSGALLTPVVGNLAHLDDLFAWRSVEQPVVAIRVSGPGIRWLQPEFIVRWTALASPGTAAAERPALSPVLLPEPPLVSIDTINGRSASGGPVQVLSANGEPLTVNGWAVDSAAAAIAGRVYLQIDNGALEVEMDYGEERPDVASYFGQPAYRLSGFRAAIDPSVFSRGQHKLRVRVLSADGKRTAVSPDGASIDVR